MKINKLAIPLMLNSVSSTIINLCDQAMVGRTYLEGFASVGIIGSIIYSITGVLGSIAVGFNILGSKSKGRNDFEDLNNSLFFSITFSILIGILFWLISVTSGKYILQKAFNIQNYALKDATIYLNIFSLSLGINLLLFNISSYFKIINKTKYILYGNLISCISNIILDYILIFGKFGFPKLGIVGNAIGSVMSLVFCLVFYIIVLYKYDLIVLTKINIVKNAKDILKISIPICFQELVESSVIVFMMNYILSQIGLLEVSVYNLLFSIINVALMPMYAYSQATLNIISEDIGSNNTGSINHTIKVCIVRSLKFYILIGIVILIFRNQIPMIITNDIDLITNASKYMFILVLVNITQIPSCIFKYSLQALGEEKYVFIYSSLTSIFSTLLIYILVFNFSKGLFSVYIGLMINYLLLNVISLSKYLVIRINY